MFGIEIPNSDHQKTNSHNNMNIIHFNTIMINAPRNNSLQLAPAY